MLPECLSGVVVQIGEPDWLAHFVAELSLTLAVEAGKLELDPQTESHVRLVEA